MTKRSQLVALIVIATYGGCGGPENKHDVVHCGNCYNSGDCTAGMCINSICCINADCSDCHMRAHCDACNTGGECTISPLATQCINGECCADDLCRDCNGDMAMPMSMMGPDMAMSSSTSDMAMTMACAGAMDMPNSGPFSFGFTAMGTQKYVVIGAANGSGGYAAMSNNTINVSGLTVGQNVVVSLVQVPGCGTTGCDATMNLTSGTTTIGPGSNCGSATLVAQNGGATLMGVVSLTVHSAAANEGIEIAPQ